MNQCMRSVGGMRCPRAGKYFPVLNLVPLENTTGSERVELPMQVALCTSHRREVTVDMLLSPETWEDLCKAFKKSGKEIPSRNHVTLTFASIEAVLKHEQEKQCQQKKSGFSLIARTLKTLRRSIGASGH